MLFVERPWILVSQCWALDPTMRPMASKLLDWEPSLSYLTIVPLRQILHYVFSTDQTSSAAKYHPPMYERHQQLAQLSLVSTTWYTQTRSFMSQVQRPILSSSPLLAISQVAPALATSYSLEMVNMVNKATPNPWMISPASTEAPKASEEDFKFKHNPQGERYLIHKPSSISSVSVVDYAPESRKSTFNFSVIETTSCIEKRNSQLANGNILHVRIMAGRGYVTTEQIPRGALILTKTPWFSLLPMNFHIPLRYTQAAEWDSLQPVASGAIFAHGSDYEKFKINALPCGVYRIPGSAITERVLGCFLLASRFNSSCRPNVHAYWNETNGCMEFRAVRDISDFEELLISYNPDMLLLEAKERQLRTLEEFGFRCHCDVCANPDPYSDSRRRHLKKIVADPGDEIDLLTDAIAMLAEEGLYHYGDTLLFDLFRARLRAKDENAVHSLRNALEWARCMVGEEHPQILQITRTLIDHPPGSQ
ncbi:hypothetical protein M408DRAFT_13160 [Serendipita vermifera MAFF 305830]|uniref:SET domain-containing protein n=1 Tax=Serendipita vermifera MAFF 305830 TaxID=933852 RepID=A0A0C2W0V2_SERVB|nr:hypothetical protein M408DRAFT_13160 [Serendipita vermifera MAFF 305830]